MKREEFHIYVPGKGNITINTGSVHEYPAYSEPERREASTEHPHFPNRYLPEWTSTRIEITPEGYTLVDGLRIPLNLPKTGWMVGDENGEIITYNEGLGMPVPTKTVLGKTSAISEFH